MIIYINDLANWLNKHFKDSKNQQTSWKITRQTHSGVEVNIEEVLAFEDMHIFHLNLNVFKNHFYAVQMSSL